MSGTSEGESSSKCLRYFSPLSARYKALLREAFVFERLCPPRLPGQGAEHLGPLLGRRRVLAGLKFVAQVREQLLKEALLLAGQRLRTQGDAPYCWPSCVLRIHLSSRYSSPPSSAIRRASGFVMPSCSHRVLAPARTASSATSGVLSGGRKTSTTSTCSGICSTDP